jgi:hypothetical protein
MKLKTGKRKTTVSRKQVRKSIEKILNGETVKRERVCIDPLYKECSLFYASGCNSCPKFQYKHE